jgi:leader peptidase (prepilin peptidase)/N-methyltransferase
LAVWSWLNPPNAIGFWGGWLVLIYFGVVAVIDIEHRLILHPVSWAGVGVGLLIGVIRNGWWETLLGGAIGFGLMWLLYWLGEIIMRGLARMRGRTPDDVALGFGDVNLSGVLGLMLGSSLILPGLLLAIFIGGLVSFFYMLVMLILRRYRLFAALPYGPFLIIGAFVFLFLGEYLLVIFAL